MVDRLAKFICECGKEFDNPQSFNGHKSHCKAHQIAKHGSLDFYKECRKKHDISCSKTLKQQVQNRKQLELEAWIAEKHICEHCGKIMTEKYGSGRFCCRACANSHAVTSSQKEIVGLKISDYHKKIKDEKIAKYLTSPNRCQICGKQLDYEHRNNLVCGRACQNKLTSNQKLELCAKQGTNLCGKGKRGYYKGYYCQSSWELAYVIYQLEHNVNFKRNTKGFSYKLDGIQRSYFPDFYLIDEDTYVEIKGYYDNKTQEKERQFPQDKKLQILKKAEMQPILEYVINKYGKNYIYLYD